MAVDDVIILDGHCPSPGSCDFESGPCLYSNRAGTDDFDWDVNQTPGTRYSVRGPRGDHTLGSAGTLSHFFYVCLCEVCGISGQMVRLRDSQSEGYGFESRLGPDIVSLGKALYGNFRHFTLVGMGT